MISVVVPTFRRPPLLLKCLRALAAQTLPAPQWEVVVVDDGHDDATRDAVAAFAAVHAAQVWRYLRPPHGRGPAVARNAGWRAARGDTIAFTDDDTEPAPSWLAEGLAALADGRHVACAGRVVVPRPAGGGAPTDHERMTRGLERADFVTANAFVRRRALLAIGGFDERFRRAWREDSDLEFRLAAVGAVGRADAAVVLHPVRPEAWGVSLRQQKNAYYDALLYAKHPRLYRERIDPRPPFDYYAIVGATLAAPLLLAVDAAAAAAGAVAFAAALVLRFAWRRLETTSHAPAHVAEMLATSALIPFLSVWWRLRGAWRFRVAFW